MEWDVVLSLLIEFRASMITNAKRKSRVEAP